MDPAHQTGVRFHDPLGKKGQQRADQRRRPSQFRFLGDPSAGFTNALDLGFDGSAIFGGIRSKRYALVVKDGRVAEAFVEPDNTGTKESMAGNVLGG